MLTEKIINAAKHGKSDYKLPDIPGRGLSLLVAATGGKLWRFRYQIDGKEKMMSLGKWPDVTLEMARDRLQVARRKVADGVDPCAEKKQERQVSKSDLRTVTELWLAQFYPERSDNKDRIVSRLTNYIYPLLGGRPMGKITAQDLLACLEVIVTAGRVDTAHRALGELTRIWTWACLKGFATVNVASFLEGQLPAAQRRKFPGITDPVKFGKLLRDIDTYRGQAETILCLRLMPYLAQRPTELREAVWEEFDLEDAIWRIPEDRMKESKKHAVPLPTQVVKLLRQLQVLSGTSGLLFPGRQRRNEYERDKPISDGTINRALRSLGYDTYRVQCAHGFRTSFSTMARDELSVNFFTKEAHLSHATGGVAGAYDEATEINARRAMIQKWADYLDKLRSSVVSGDQARPAAASAS